MKNILSTLLVSVLLLGCSTDDDTMADILPTTIDLDTLIHLLLDISILE